MNKYIREGGWHFHQAKGRYRNPYAIGSSRYNDFERGWFQSLKRSPDSLFDEHETEETPDLTRELIERYESERGVIYRGEIYRVRDNGAIFRQPKKGGRRRKLDSMWTFGQPCKLTGYMSLAGQRVHRIVATAFHGEQSSDQHVVDHVDTNRRNNRPDNLRWITRLDNILMNPITKRRIELSYGSLDEFFRDPSRPKGVKLPKNYEWMRTVSKEEAEASRKRIEGWAKSGVKPTGEHLGEWVYRDEAISVQYAGEITKESLTPGVFQRNWRVPTEFPTCPDDHSEDVLSRYQKRLASGTTFSANKYGTSSVVIAELSDNGTLSVITRLGDDSVKPFAVARVVREEQMIIHESCGTFFTLEGVSKAHCEQLAVLWKEHCERRGLPWGDSIDNYC